MVAFRWAAVAAAALTAGPAAAWNPAGHMATGAIAYQVLDRDSPTALAAAVALLQAHPSYHKLWKGKLADVPPADRHLYLFMLAPRWADDVRNDPAFDRPTWHYVTHPYTPPGADPPGVPIPPAPAADAVTAFADNRGRLTAARDPADRAVALTWVCHLVGDIHQPLHTTSLFTADFPDGDRGGNRFWVKAGPAARPVNLHSLWDGAVTGRDGFRDVRNTAAELRRRPEFAPDRLPELAEPRFAAWAKGESHELAKKAAYLDGKLAGGTAEFSAVVLPPGYLKAAKAVAERRVVLAGHRLARVIRDALGGPPGLKGE